MRTARLIAVFPAAWLAIAVCLPATAEAQWAADGVRVSSVSFQDAAFSVGDGGGGAFFLLRDRSATSGDHCRVQHRTRDGQPAPGWTPDGLRISEENRQDEYPVDGCLNADGSLSAVIRGGFGDRSWIQRVSAAGSIAPGWPASPILFASFDGLVGDMGAAHIVPTIDGGNLLLWQQDAGDGLGNEIFVQRFGPTGALSPGWPTGGRQLIGGPENQTIEFVYPIAGGGSTVFYGSLDPAHPGRFICQVSDAGSIDSTWAGGGLRVVPVFAGAAAGKLVPDSNGGFYFAWGDYRTGRGLPFPQYEDYYDIYLQRITSDGHFASGWPLDGMPVCIWPGRQWFPDVASDGNGGAFVAWGWSGPQGNGIHAQHMLADGSVAPGWPVGGKQIFGASGYQDYPIVTSDGLGGFFAAASIMRVSGYFQMFAQHLNARGDFDAGWSANGYQLVSLASNQDTPFLLASEPGAAIVNWSDYRPDPEVFAQKLVVGGVVATSVALVSIEAEPGRVTLAWFASGIISGATVERRDDVHDWSSLATVSPDGTGRLAYEDQDVVPGTRYDYRLTWSEGAVSQHTAETWISVPLAARFALAGAAPNPSPRGDLRVAFSLAQQAPGFMRLFDAQGRCIASRDIGGDGPGDHVLPLSTARTLHAGIYWLRLSQGAQSATSRVVLVN